MTYTIITEKNYPLLDSILHEDDSQYDGNTEHIYKHLSLLFMGEDLFNKFSGEYGCKLRPYEFPAPSTVTTKTDAVKLVAGYSVSYYRNFRTGEDDFSDCSVRQYAFVDGEWWSIYGASRCGKTCYFSLLNDDTNYDVLNKEERYDYPNAVSVFTDKKLQEWKTFLHNRREKAMKIMNDRQSKVDAFLDKVKRIPANVKGRGDEHSGHFTSNHFRFSYEIDLNGNISTKLDINYISYLYDCENIDFFEKLVSAGF